MAVMASATSSLGRASVGTRDRTAVLKVAPPILSVVGPHGTKGTRGNRRGATQGACHAVSVGRAKDALSSCAVSSLDLTTSYSMDLAHRRPRSRSLAVAFVLRRVGSPQRREVATRRAGAFSRVNSRHAS